MLLQADTPLLPLDAAEGPPARFGSRYGLNSAVLAGYRRQCSAAKVNPGDGVGSRRRALAAGLDLHRDEPSAAFKRHGRADDDATETHVLAHPNPTELGNAGPIRVKIELVYPQGEAFVEALLFEFRITEFALLAGLPGVPKEVGEGDAKVGDGLSTGALRDLIGARSFGLAVSFQRPLNNRY
jgi:hypothetical protein